MSEEPSICPFIGSGGFVIGGRKFEYHEIHECRVAENISCSNQFCLTVKYLECYWYLRNKNE